MATNVSRLAVQLEDQFSGPARAIGRSTNAMRESFKDVARGPATLGQRIEASMTRTNRALDETRGRFLDAVAGFYVLREAFGAPIGSAIELETKLSGIQSKAGLSAEGVAQLRTALREASGATNQYTTDLASGIDYLTGMGMSSTDATAAIKSIGMASTASGASVQDMSAAGFAAMSNLKVTAEELPRAFDAMAAAGKNGGFELRDMASYFPNLGSAYASLGQGGVGAVADLSAALQVIRADTGDASSAATNLQNVIQKTFAPATVAKFKEKGVDIFKEMDAAAKRGLTPIEAIAEITNKTLGGDLSKLGFLFEDSQAQAGIRSLIQRMEEYRKIREEAMGAGGTNQADFDRAMNTTEEKAKSAKIAFTNLGESIGAALLPAVRQLSTWLKPIIERFAKFVEDNPSLVAGIVSAAGSFIALRAAMAGLSFVGLMGKSGALSVLSFGVNSLGGSLLRLKGGTTEMVRLQRTLAKMDGKSLGILGRFRAGIRGMALAAPGVGSLGTALSGIGGAVATISLPVWGTFALAAVGIGSAGLVIWKYWDRISSVFSGAGKALSEILAPAVDWASQKLSSFNGDIRDGVGKIAEYFGGDSKAAIEAYDRIMKSAFDFSYIKGAVEKAKNWLGSLFTQETLTDAEKEKAKKSGYDFVMSLWNGMKKTFNQLVAWVSTKVDELMAPVRNLANKVTGMFGGAVEGVTSDPMGTGAVDGQRAKGGPISKGGSYLVGEKGPELITAGRSGYVNKAGASASAGPITLNQSLHFNIQGKADEDVIEKIRRVMRDEVRETFRGVFADTGMRMA